MLVSGSTVLLTIIRLCASMNMDMCICIYNRSYQFHMYSCNDNSWKELKHDFPLKLSFDQECVIVRGNPYWACVRPDLNYLWVKVNVQSEEIRMFHGPEYVMNEMTRSSVMALGDSVAEAVFSPGAEANQMIHLYTFEENSGVWMRIYSLELFGLRRQPLSFMMPLFCDHR